MSNAGVPTLYQPEIYFSTDQVAKSYHRLLMRIYIYKIIIVFIFLIKPMIINIDTVFIFRQQSQKKGCYVITYDYESIHIIVSLYFDSCPKHGSCETAGAKPKHLVAALDSWIRQT